MMGISHYGHATILAGYTGKLKTCTFESDSTMPLLHTSWRSSSGSLLSAVGSGFVYPASSKLSLITYALIVGIVSQMQVNDGPVSPVPLPSPIIPSFTNVMLIRDATVHT